jgi:hypothetical protein
MSRSSEADGARPKERAMRQAAAAAQALRELRARAPQRDRHPFRIDPAKKGPDAPSHGSRFACPIAMGKSSPYLEQLTVWRRDCEHAVTRLQRQCQRE